eukprot:CAMPEP_0118904592 /NCGR_PEP_ID=MMETSP1166-20130328/8993_1 /TAXON_ID=1104430 /ORGANISM="Chrysoreinhardia sp, Strain CCMP3193" /LENGTH=184 /DNA_ID=CAMNT_0006843849 /DNA_START=77 /DNA_END=631 /DNA_ORIENTATION=-
MGFLSIVRKLREKEREMKLLMVGLDNAGKTTVVKKFKGEATDTISPTLGFDISTLEHRGYRLNVWDVGGQQTLRSYWRNYFEVTDGIVWVVDSADKWRLGLCRDELHTLLKEEQLQGASLLIFANKQDLPGAVVDDAALADLLQLNDLRKRHFKIQPCSAQSGDGLKDGIDWIVEDIASRIMLD